MASGPVTPGIMSDYILHRIDNLFLLALLVFVVWASSSRIHSLEERLDKLEKTQEVKKLP